MKFTLPLVYSEELKRPDYLLVTPVLISSSHSPRESKLSHAWRYGERNDLSC